MSVGVGKRRGVSVWGEGECGGGEEARGKCVGGVRGGGEVCVGGG